MNVRLSERDLKVLAKCAVSKWLTTSQLRRLYFQNVTADAACKSLRRLTKTGCLLSFRANRMCEALHAIGPNGKAALAAKGLEVEVSRRPPRQVEHMVGINHVRVSLETHPGRVVYFFACWELGKFGWPHPVIPDAVFELNYPRRCKFALEFDRATEPFNVFWQKLCSYAAIFSDSTLNAVALVTETRERLRTILRHLDTRVSPIPILGTSLPDIQNTDIYSAVFRDACEPDQPARSLCEPHPRAALEKD